MEIACKSCASMLGPVRAVVCFAIWAATGLPAAHATVLWFDEQRDAATSSVVGPTMSGGNLPADYGDRVGGAVDAVPGGSFTYGNGGEGFTPNVSVDIFAAGATAADAHVRLWQAGYGDLLNVAFGEGPGTAGAPILSVRLSADPGYAVDLYGFDLAAFSNTDYTIAAVEVFAGATPVFALIDVRVEGDGDGPLHTGFVFDPPLSAPQLLLQIDLSTLPPGIQDNIGLDSLRFGQTPQPIPEPGTAALWLGGFASLAAWARSRRRAALAPA